MKERCLDGRRFFDATYDAWGRLTWELPQTNLGLNYSYFRLLTDDIDAVEYFDGATYVIDENNKKRNSVTLGSYIWTLYAEPRIWLWVLIQRWYSWFMGLVPFWTW